MKALVSVVEGSTAAPVLAYLNNLIEQDDRAIKRRCGHFCANTNRFSPGSLDLNT
jgi:transposase-like protein